ncbi:MAG: GlmU family protein [Bacteroidota bacterium]|nr:GlmU family protein [Bacteroidota bacterium]
MNEMPNLVFFDDESLKHLYPLTLTRPSANLLCGILTIAEKWSKYLNTSSYSYLTSEHLQAKFPLKSNDNNCFINGRLLPNTELIQAIKHLDDNASLMKGSQLLSCKGNQLHNNQAIQFEGDITLIDRTHQLFTLNANQIKADFELLCFNRVSQTLSSTNIKIGDYPVFLEAGAKIEASILNTTEGPIYIGKDAEIMEGSMLRGPFALGEHGVVKMGAKIYSGTTVGAYSKVGGEVNNSVIFAYSNKGHDGFLGNSVLGEWCNLGADTNNSNLKNNYEAVKLWNYETANFEKTGLQFCGLIMGDHSKCGINTMFNTGTVVGVSANIFGSGFPRNFVPSFSWGGAQGFETYSIKKAFQTATIVMGRRNQELTNLDQSILEYIFQLDSNYRTWEKNDK